MKNFGIKNIAGEGAGAPSVLGRLLGLMMIMFAVLAMLATAPKARAQFGNGDLFGAPRIFTWNVINMTNHSGTGNFSNAPIDLHGCDGVASLFFAVTNYAGNAGTPTIYARVLGSLDNTNWYLMTNTSYATMTTYNITNRNGGTIATNTYMLPGTLTTPTAATAGFASVYLVPQPFTNFAVLCTNVAYTNAVIGWSVQDGPRYVQIAYTVTGTDVAFSPVAVLYTRRAAGDVFY